MNKVRNFTILKESWKKCEEFIKRLAEQSIPKESMQSMPKDIIAFLEDVGFCKKEIRKGEVVDLCAPFFGNKHSTDREEEKLTEKEIRKEKIVDHPFASFFGNRTIEEEKLTEKGEEYYKNKFIFKDKEEAKKNLAESLKSYEPVQIICQVLWGRENLDKESIYRLLLLEKCISPKFGSSDLGGFLMLLNYCGILKYSKGTNKITILYNPKIENEDKPTKRFLSPETPYSNIKALRESLRKCKEYIWWFDKHFSPKGFEPLAEEADGTKIKGIRILTGLTDNVNDKLKRDFTRFQKEIRNRGIDVELRVICEKNLFHDIHDRWIISKNICFNLPPINTIYRGQYAEIKETENTPPFEDWWQKGFDLVKDWQSILTKKSKI